MRKGFTLIELMIVIAIIAAIAIPNLLEARKSGNEAAALGSLKAITTAQTLYREGSKDSAGNNNYATLTQLGATNLVDTVLGGGNFTKTGYSFASGPSSVTTSAPFVWSAVADPVVPKNTGDRYFATNNSGVIYFTLGKPIAPDGATGAVAATDGNPIGK